MKVRGSRLRGREGLLGGAPGSLGAAALLRVIIQQRAQVMFVKAQRGNRTE